MTKIPKRILFTRSLNSEQVEFGTKLNCLIDHHTFIRIDLCQLDQKTIDIINSGDYPNWIFTSQNAVRSLAQIKSDIQFNQVKKCFAVGEKTADMLKEIGLSAEIPQRHNAEALSHLLEDYSAESFLYFTGNLRQDTLINFFEEREIPYKEIKVYETHLIQPEIDLDIYDAICFCSPSAVHSFFKNYQLKNNQPCFAIGYTTAAALVDYSDNVMLADQTNVYALIQTCNQYLNS
ncbi:uroporphyrinogen-III synthase [Ancylomarina salipaludis]|uniref:Uroporphyrinogen-III synthase n=1 Tax=Ancylomarina salipaludis TaxID=2501299 RepID=A0A4Q1JJ22_9BACT|nr:uroporphyrinogen-III synthase [Ancylomarina salipaludis]RXQ89502.1 uroporphyrinogen-III synthase [Ancylomarina salipaludis]